MAAKTPLLLHISCRSNFWRQSCRRYSKQAPPWTRSFQTPVSTLSQLGSFTVKSPRYSQKAHTRSASTHTEAQKADQLISSLPLIRHLRSLTHIRESNSPTSESRQFQTMHPKASATHLITNSLHGPGKLPTSPNFFLRADPTCRLTAACYIGSHLNGHAGFVHGGLLFSLFDDAFARCASSVFASGVGMTAHWDMDFRKPSLPERVYVYRVEVVRVEGRKAWVEGQMRCLNAFAEGEMLQRPVARGDGVSVEESEGALVAEARALFVEPKDATGMVPLYPKD